MIRAATHADLPALLELGARMHAESPRFSRIAFSAAKLHQTLSSVLASRHGFLWVAERGGTLAGVMVACAFEHWCSEDLMATEMALFVEQEHRGTLIAAKLISQYLAWAEGLGAKIITAGVSTGVHVEKTTRLYEALGMKRFGTMLEV